MKITKQQLKQIIKEELKSVLGEIRYLGSFTDPTPRSETTVAVHDILNQAAAEARSGNHSEVAPLLRRAEDMAVRAGDEQAQEAVNSMTREIKRKWPEIFGLPSEEEELEL